MNNLSFKINVVYIGSWSSMTGYADFPFDVKCLYYSSRLLPMIYDIIKEGK